MIAFATRVLLAIQLAAAVALYRWLEPWIASPALATLAAVAIVIGIRFAITANNFRIARRTYPSAASDSIRGWRFVRLMLEEFCATMISSSWRMPFCRVGIQHDVERQGLPVLLIHGYLCNSGYWRSFSRALGAARIEHMAIDIEPVFGSIDAYVPKVAAAIDALCRDRSGKGKASDEANAGDEGSARIIIVGHSMGGLIARAYLREYGTARVARLITLGTPHHGTLLADGGIGRNCVQMHRRDLAEDGIGSAWLRSLAATESATARQSITSIYSLHDNIVTPQESACLGGAHNVPFVAIGHVALAGNRSVQQRVIDEIQAIGKGP